MPKTDETPDVVSEDLLRRLHEPGVEGGERLLRRVRDDRSLAAD